ncbi:MAG: phospholipase [Alphaproteobacteria bacterium]
MTNDINEILVEALAASLPPLLTALDGLAYISRHMHPPHLAELVARMGGGDQGVREGITALQNAPWPGHMAEVKSRIETAAEQVCQSYDSLRIAVRNPNGVMEAYYALRYATQAQEALYPLTALMPLVGRFFLNERARADAGLLDRLEQGAGQPNTGIMHSKSAKGEKRGGFSLYVPESYDAASKHPLIFALHGGSGNGRAFLWSWLRTARSNGAILISPSSRGSTWALQGPDIDTPNLLSMLNYVQERWNVDDAHVLMSGMSDGGTFTYISGMQEGQPFTHLAPVAASFHPMLLEFFPAERIRGLPFHITHGALDWMFPASSARETAGALDLMGARVVYREFADLSHTYPDNEEHGQIYDWFMNES